MTVNHVLMVTLKTAKNTATEMFFAHSFVYNAENRVDFLGNFLNVPNFKVDQEIC